MESGEPQGELCSRRDPVREDMALQRKVWRFERWGWYGLLLLVALTLGSLFSKGPLSEAQVHSADSQVRVEYQRFLRNGASDTLVIHLRGQPNTALEARIEGELLQGFNVEMLQPQPLKASAAGQGVKLWVLSDADGQAVLRLNLRSDGVGRFDTQVALGAGAALQFSQFIYP